jgi:hypothetical protein
MSDCPYTWRIFFAGVAAGVCSVVVVTTIVAALVLRRKPQTSPTDD